MTDVEKQKITDTLLYLAEPYRIQAMRRYFPEINQNKELSERCCKLADQVQKANLSEEDRQTVDDFTCQMQELQDLQLSIMYVAGILDGCTFLQDHGIFQKLFEQL